MAFNELPPSITRQRRPGAETTGGKQVRFVLQANIAEWAAGRRQTHHAYKEKTSLATCGIAETFSSARRSFRAFTGPGNVGFDRNTPIRSA